MTEKQNEMTVTELTAAIVPYIVSKKLQSVIYRRSSAYPITIEYLLC